MQNSKFDQCAGSSGQAQDVTVLPHVGLGGGAGLYIRQIAAYLDPHFSVRFGGPSAGSYGLPSTQQFEEIRGIVFPNYAGVQNLKVLYFFIQALFRLVREFFVQREIVAAPGLLILTSGIQLLTLPVLRRTHPNKKICILIQENWRLDNGLWGALSVRFLRQMNRVISITDGWTEYAARHGVAASTVKNSFSATPGAAPADALAPSFDAAYLGGDQKIKGFDTLLRLFSRLGKLRAIKIALLGHYSPASIEKISRLNALAANGSALVLIGQRDDTADFLVRSKFLFLPITSPHFCRPAVEAGIVNRTFLTTSFDGIGDFAVADHNCLFFDPASDADLDRKFTQIIDDQRLRTRLADANRAFSLSFMESEHGSSRFRDLMAATC